MEITFLGHSAFKIVGSGKTLIIDPFLAGNPTASVQPADLRDIDLVLVTHGHGDHLGNAVDIACATGATFIGIFEIANYARSRGVRNVESMNVGGTIVLDPIRITMTNATHSSDFAEGSGHAAGYVIDFGEHTVYHAGDTGISYDMKLIHELYAPDIAMLPIGSRVTMGIKEATKAVELLKPGIVIPMHYGTFPHIMQDPEEFKKSVGEMARVIVLRPGQSITI